MSELKCTKKFYKVCEELIDGKVIYESQNAFPTRADFMEYEKEAEGTDQLLYSILADLVWKSKSTHELVNGYMSFLEVVKVTGVKEDDDEEKLAKIWRLLMEEVENIRRRESESRKSKALA